MKKGEYEIYTQCNLKNIMSTIKYVVEKSGWSPDCIDLNEVKELIKEIRNSEENSWFDGSIIDENTELFYSILKGKDKIYGTIYFTWHIPE